MRTIIFFFLLLISLFVHAQERLELRQFYTPNTYAFARYGDLPVNHCTGIPQIVIPLTSISDKDLQMDVSLSYHASGIKVDQEASWVGLGWSLNAGGMITCQMRGVPDRMGSDGKMERVELRLRDHYNETLEAFISSERNKWSGIADLRFNSLDPAPDIFYFNFCGRTGKFYLDEDGKGRMQDQEDCIIEFQQNGTFKITDERGVVYLFEDKEFAYHTGLQTTHTTGWYLSSMTSPAGGHITFSYTDGGTLGNSVIRHTYSSCYIPLNKEVSTHYIPSDYLRPLICCNSNESMKGVVLTSIEASSGAHIDFTCKNGKRKDAYNVNGNVLEYVTAYNSNGDVCKKYRFFHDYFEPDEGHKITLSSYSFLNYRLCLKSVQELAAVGTDTLPPYRFAYYGDGGSATNNVYALPHRLSPCQDHWGYYNHTDNKTLFAGNGMNEVFYTDPWYQRLVPYYLQMSFMKGYRIANGADRTMHTEAVKACVLKKITYPTGGHTEFDFETHDIDYNLGRIGMGGLRIKRITDDDGNGTQKIRDYIYQNYGWGDNKYQLENNLYHIHYSQGSEYYVSEGLCTDILAAYGIPGEHLGQVDVLQINTFPTIALGVESDFMYPRVTEYVRGQGRTEYSYTYEENHRLDTPDLDGLTVSYWLQANHVLLDNGLFHPANWDMAECTSYDFPFMTEPDLGWMRGQLESKKVYTEDNRLVAADYMTYEHRLLGAEAGGKAVRINDKEYLLARDYLLSGRTRLKREIHETYGDDGQAFRTMKEYTYGAARHKLASEIKETASDGDTIITRYYYPHDYDLNAHAVLKSMNDKNILAPIDVRAYKGGRLLHGEQTAYNAFGQPETHYRAETAATDIAFSRSNPFTFSAYLWHTYDANKLLVTEKTRENDLPHTYLWAYGNQYPVARIVGATYSEVTAWLATASVPLPNALTDTTAIKARLTAIRNALADKGVQVTTCLYLPDVGMTSWTDINGRVTDYRYDNFRRLSAVDDEEGCTVEEYEYHFAN